MMNRIRFNSTFFHLIKLQRGCGPRISVDRNIHFLAAANTQKHVTNFTSRASSLTRNNQRSFQYSASCLDEKSVKSNGLAPVNSETDLQSFSFLRLFAGITRRGVLRARGIQLYDSCVTRVYYDYFYEALDMPDTLQSWFLILNLHVWMCLVRLKQEGKDGRVVYREIVSTMWQDVQERAKILGVSDPSTRNKSIQVLYNQFNGVIIAYDMGIVSDDHVLAAALWRNLVVDKTKIDPVVLANIVHYVRNQVHSLEQKDSEEILSPGAHNWQDPSKLDSKHFK